MVETVCFYFQVHQPYRIRPFNLFSGGPYFDGELNRHHLLKAVRDCYLPANNLIGRLARRHGERFGVAFSLSGTVLQQLAEVAPEAVESFAALGASGAAEFLGETDYHSLASVFSPAEFRDQVEAHRRRMERTFGVSPAVFRNTELIYRDDLAGVLKSLGYDAVLVEGVDRLLAGKSPHGLFRSRDGKASLLVKDHRLSDDIAFRFSDPAWEEWPLSPDAFAGKLRRAPGEFANLFMDYETFGEHHVPATGIFTFFERMIDAFLESPRARIVAPGTILAAHGPGDVFEAPEFISWADEARDLSAWLGNDMQRSAARNLYSLETAVKEAGDEAILEDWRKLQTSDHLYYMSTKGEADGGVHTYFSPHPTPYDAFASFINILHDLEIRASSHRGSDD